MSPAFMLEISSEIDTESPEKVTVHLAGRLSQTEVKRLRAEFDRLVSCGYKHIDVDMSDLLYIDSSGLAEFVPIYQMVRENEGGLCLTNPRRLIRHILVSAHLDDIFEIHPHDDNK